MSMHQKAPELFSSYEEALHLHCFWTARQSSETTNQTILLPYATNQVQ